MEFRAKAVALLACAVAVPVLLLGWTSYDANRRELEATVGQLHTRSAEETAEAIEQQVLHGVESLSLSAGSLPLHEFTKTELAEVLRLPYRQVKSVTTLLLLDDTGTAVVPPVFERREGEAQLPLPTSADLSELSRHVPFRDALALGAAVGPPYRSPSGGPSRVVVAVRTQSTPPMVVAAELALDGAQSRLDRLTGEGRAATLLDATGAWVAGHEALATALSALPARTGPAASSHVLVLDGARWSTAVAQMPRLHWTVGLAQPERVVLGPALRVRTYTLYWMAVALLMAVALGTAVARGLSGPIATLVDAARALTAGRFDHRVAVDRKDELGALAIAFNHMSAEVQRRDQEIREWNDTLQRRVDEKTKALEDAQDQVARARRLAAMGALGAGVAHELNNPLAAVIGLATILKSSLPRDSPDAPLAEGIVTEARRATIIIERVRQLSETELEGAGQRFALALPVRAALEALQATLTAKHIALSMQLDGEGFEVQGNQQALQQVVSALLENAVTALPDGGALNVALSTVGREAVRLVVKDNGPGIPANLKDRIFDPFFSTKAQSGSVGLGLSLSHQIVSNHHGKLTVESEPGLGAAFTVVLPAAAQAPHLE